MGCSLIILTIVCFIRFITLIIDSDKSAGTFIIYPVVICNYRFLLGAVELRPVRLCVLEAVHIPLIRQRRTLTLPEFQEYRS